MKLTIIPSDGAVYKNGLCYMALTWDGTPSDVHALQWQEVSGWIEFNTGASNETINALPVWANNALAAWDAANNPPPPPPPTAEQNKITAVQKLKDTDWVNEPDVYDPARNPHLMNRDAFLDYRSWCRNIAINPVAGNLNWPTEPVAIWSQA